MMGIRIIYFAREWRFYLSKVLSQRGPQSMFGLSQAFHAEGVIEFDSNYMVGPKTSYKWSYGARVNGLK